MGAGIWVRDGATGEGTRGLQGLVRTRENDWGEKRRLEGTRDDTDKGQEGLEGLARSRDKWRKGGGWRG